MTVTEYPHLGETLHSFTCPNGLTVKIVPRPGFQKKLAYFITDFGSVHQDFRLEGQEYHMPAGIAHFLEHKMFELPDRDVTGEFAELGANVNAFTSYDMTAYYFSCSQNFEENLRLLLEFVSTPYFPAESVQREMGIIDQEIGMNEDAPDSRIFDSLMECLYEKHNIRLPILGSRESIRQITPELLHLCHRAFYNPGNMVLCVVGDVDSQQVIHIAREVLGNERRPVGEKLPAQPEPVTAVCGLVRQQMEVAMPTFQLAFKCEPVGKGAGAVRQEIAADLAAEALFGESSRLYLRLYEQGLIDSSFGGGFETVDSCAMLTCGGDSDDPEAVRDAILAEAALILEQGMEDSDFLRMKRSAMGRRIRDLDSFDSTCFRVCAYHLGGFDYFAFPEIYAEITKNEVLAFLSRVVKKERCALSVMDPCDKKEEI